MLIFNKTCKDKLYASYLIYALKYALYIYLMNVPHGPKVHFHDYMSFAVTMIDVKRAINKFFNFSIKGNK